MTVKHTLVSSDMRVFALCSLMELHRSKKAGTRTETVHPLCVGERRGHLRAGADDGAVPDCARHSQHYHGRCRIWERTGDGTAAGDYYRSGGLRIF